MAINRTPFAVLEAPLTDRDGAEVLVVVVKGTFTWGPDGEATPAAEQLPILTADVPAGDGPHAGLAAASDVCLSKPRVDVLLQGEIVLPRPMEQVDCALEVGARLRKTLRVFGPRVWVLGAVKALVPWKSQPFSRMPIAWERSFGGADLMDSEFYEARNPAGSGVCKKPRDLDGRPAPNFENPEHPLAGLLGHPVPVGFGPIAPHWQPRIGFAGTYDEAWLEQRCPLLPADFDPRFLNVAPADQQLEGFVAGEEVRLANMTARGHERFRLPLFAPAVTILDDGYIIERKATVDTITLYPEKPAVSLTARLVWRPRTNILGIGGVFVGSLSRGQRRALETGKVYRELRLAKASDAEPSDDLADEGE